MSYQNNRIFTLNEPNAPRLNPALACEIGLNESLLLLQLEFWISISNNERDGQKWTYQSTRDIQENTFPFWSVMTINRAIKSLEAKGLIFTTTKYNKFKYDKTRWFALNFQGLSRLGSISIVEHVTRSNQNDTGSNQNDTGSNQDGTTIPETSTEITNKDYDDMQAGPSSSSLSELMELIPEQFRKPSVEKTIKKGLSVHGEVYVKNAALYTVSHSNGDSWQKFKAYLGKCIDNGWADGWEPVLDQGGSVDIAAVKDQFRKMDVGALKPLADAGNQFAVAELDRRNELKKEH